MTQIHHRQLPQMIPAAWISPDKLESHHINMQKDFVSDINGQINKKKKHIVKDSKANLIVLCSKCHDNLHSGNFTISGLVKSSNGIKVI